MANPGKAKVNPTTVLIIICAVIITIFAVLAFWYIKIYSNDPLVILSRQAPALSMTLPGDTGKYQKIADDVIPYDKNTNGSIVAFHNFNIQLSGKIKEQTGYEKSDALTASYEIEDAPVPHQVNMSIQPLEEYNDYITKFIEEGDNTLFTTAFGDGGITKYYTPFMTMYVPIGENSAINKTYMVIPNVDEENVLLIQSDDPITLTSKMSSKIYRKPEDTVYTQRVFSSYEIAAVENTRNQMNGDVPAQEVVDDTEPTEDFETPSTDDAPKYTHEQLVEIDAHLARERLKEDGSIAGTTMQLTTDSEDDIASEADITQGTIPVVTVDGLHIDNVSFQYDAAKNGDTLIFKGLTQSAQNSLDIQNNNSSAAEFIMVVKFISTDGRILDFVKINNLDSPLEVEEKRTFAMNLTDVKYSGTLQKIQFEVWR